jgi:hypothetical protein
MQNRRFTRLTNAFSKKFEMHRPMIAITVEFYNSCKTHGSLRGKTPAMASGLRDYVWTASTCARWTRCGRRRPPSPFLRVDYYRPDAEM